MSTKAQKKLFSSLADLGCILCWHKGWEGTLAEIHHIRRGGKRDTAPVIPLCPEHHRGNTGIHGLGRKGFERTHGISEDSLLQMCNDIFRLQGKDELQQL
jgi:Recombination enhancement, RecA-dependent nuclease